MNHDELLSEKYDLLSKSTHDRKWFQITLTGDIYRSDVEMLIHDIEMDLGTDVICGTMYQCIPPYHTTITLNHTGYLPPKYIIATHADRIIDIGFIDIPSDVIEALSGGPYKSCPFCGSSNILVSTHHEFNLDWFVLHCVDCGCRTGNESSRDTAIDKWNRRAE